MLTGYGRILLCVDFSEESDRVAARARDIADRYGAGLRLIHVVEHLPVDTTGEFMAPQQILAHEDMLENATERLHRIAERIGVPSADCCVAAGYTKQEILAHAKDIQCDLIVVGSHGRHGLALLLGSTANALLHGAECDVLAVRV